MTHTIQLKYVIIIYYDKFYTYVYTVFGIRLILVGVFIVQLTVKIDVSLALYSNCGS